MILQCVYRLTLHPLAKFPGPKFAACSKLWFFYWIARGRVPETCGRLYEKYDTIVLRVAPNQLLFRTAESFKQIIGRNDVHKDAFSTRVFEFHATHVSNIKDPVAHRRKRRLTNLGFAANVLVKQDPTLILPLIESW
jgi:hypothetical protein